MGNVIEVNHFTEVQDDKSINVSNEGKTMEKDTSVENTSDICNTEKNRYM